PMDQLNGTALLGVARHDAPGGRRGFVGGVVQDLNLQAVPGAIDGADSLHQPGQNVFFVVKRKLNGDEGNLFQLLEVWGLGDAPVPVAKIKIGQIIAMNAEDGEDRQDEKIQTDEQLKKQVHSWQIS